MATLASIATGNFTDAATWALCDATSENNSEAATSVANTLYVASSNFTPGAITVDAIGIHVAFRNGTTGTITVELYNSTAAASVAGTEVSINTADIQAGSASGEGGSGWYFFKFSAPVTLLAATNYAVRVKTSSPNMVTLYTSASTNYSRQLRTTTTQAPAAADNLLIQGEWTAASTSSSFTVTNDNTATTDFGAVYIGDKGTLTFGTTASTNYYLKMSGIMRLTGGTLNVGTTGTPMPSTSTAVLEFDSTSSGEFGLQVCGGSTLVMQGAAKTAYSKMTADKAIAATSIDVVDTTGWAANDVLVFPTTTRTLSQTETKSISTVNSGTNITLSAGLTNAHGGDAATKVQATVGNLTRNVKVRGVSTSSGSSYIRVYAALATTTVDIDNIECTYLGSSFSGRLGITNELGTIGTFSIENSTSHTVSTSASGIGINFSSATGNGHEAVNNVIYRTSGDVSTNQVATTGVNVWDGNVCYADSSSRNGMNFLDNGCTVTNNVVAGTGYGIQITESSGAALGTVSGNICHSVQNICITIVGGVSGTVSNCIAWRSTGVGFSLSGTSFVSGSAHSIILDTCEAFGTNGICLEMSGLYWKSILIKDCSFQAGTTLTAIRGVRFSSNLCCESIIFNGCSLGNVTAFTTSCIDFSVCGIFQAYFYDTAIQSTVPYLNANTNLRDPAGLAFMPFNNTANDYRYVTGAGVASYDSTIYNTAAPSLRLTPYSSGTTLVVKNQASSTKIVPVESGDTITVSVYVRKSAAGDGTAYTGFQPRLMVKANPLMGYDTDTVLDTAAAATGTWEELTATTSAAPVDGALEFYVDCGPTAPSPTTVAGWVNVDDFTTTSTLADTDMKFWINGMPDVNANGSGSPGGSGGSFPFC